MGKATTRIQLRREGSENKAERCPKCSRNRKRVRWTRRRPPSRRGAEQTRTGGDREPSGAERSRVVPSGNRARPDHERLRPQIPGGTGAALYVLRLALFNPDVSWDRKNNPEPWNKLGPNEQYKDLPSEHCGYLWDVMALMRRAVNLPTTGKSTSDSPNMM
ncbi:NADH dehydrogenase [ubiquinone] 1 alpha subcomplex subunit 4 [Pteropus alecto]|uniref:Cytochrome c oxidase subunit NDUFA4 n=1 Tax=Pteropus alecto TaxID=9402 RepID=L5KNP9_PTEAL|nr:NADH dehydrogenase [ubiquinone] 1 alpha subcomplex subunit 4 [Pteropus alecto]